MSSIIKAHTLDENAPMAIQPELPLETAPVKKAVLPRSPRPGAVEALRKARQQAAALLAAAQAEAEQMKEQARSEGYAEGLRAGREQGMREGVAEGLASGWGSGVEKAQQVVRSAQEMLSAAEEERAKALEDLEGKVVELALAVAEKIVQKEIEQDEVYLSRLIKSALQQVGAAKQVVARVNPASAAQLAHTEGFALEMAGKLQVMVDDTLEVGDCVIETESGLLDGCLSTRFAAIQQAMEKAIEA